MAKLIKACPQFPAVDVRKTAEWYRDRLGFRIARIERDNTFAIVERDGVEIHFWICADRHIAEHTSAYIRVDDIEGVHKLMGKASLGGTISKVGVRDWGMREFYVTDPEGNLLKFGVPAGSREGVVQ